MDNSRPAADRVRHVLRAMEQSIDAARQRRLHRSDHREIPTGSPIPVEQEAPSAGEEPVTRLKARPKRPSHVSEFDRGSSFRSRAS